MTDPSYDGQIITFTYPHIGNTGINSEDYESKSVFARGIVVRNFVISRVIGVAKNPLRVF